jgi:hypothetical protein
LTVEIGGLLLGLDEKVLTKIYSGDLSATSKEL